MIVYRHLTAVTPPDLSDWTHRDSAVALCHQRAGDRQYVAVADPVLWQINEGAAWRSIGEGWEAALVRDRGGVVPSRDLARLSCWAPVLTVEDARGDQWLAPVILTQDGHRAFPVSYAGADFLPAPTPDQVRAEAIAREARAELARAADGDGGSGGIPTAAACRWAAVLLSITSHVSTSTVAELGILDDALARRVLIAATGIDRRLDGPL